MRPDIVQTHPFIDQWRAKGFQYYIVPKAMLRTGRQFGLGMDEVMLYVILRDRVNLSYENRWVDENGRIYIIYTREDAAKYLGWSIRKTIDVFARLVDSGLLTERTQHSTGVLKMPKRLYVRQWAEASVLHSVEELKNGGFSYLTEDTVHADVGDYYMLPQCLLQDPIYEGLGLRAALVYMIALDKLHLSLKYGKVDDKGLVWCSLDTQEVCAELGCNEKTLGRAYKTLEEIGLIVRTRNGSNTKTQYRIYLRDYLPPRRDCCPLPDEGPGPESQTKLQAATEEYAYGAGQDCTWGRTNFQVEAATLAYGSSESCIRGETELPAGSDKATVGEATKMHPNNRSHPSGQNNLSLVSIGETPTLPKRRENLETNHAASLVQTELAIRRQIAYLDLTEDILLCMPPDHTEDAIRLLDLSVRIMAEDASAIGTQIRLGNNFIDKQTALAAYRGLDRYILYTMLTKITSRVSEIRNLTLYVHQALLKAVENHAGEAYYTRLLIEERRMPHTTEMNDSSSNNAWPW